MIDTDSINQPILLYIKNSFFLFIKEKNVKKIDGKINFFSRKLI